MSAMIKVYGVKGMIYRDNVYKKHGMQCIHISVFIAVIVVASVHLHAPVKLCLAS